MLKTKLHANLAGRDQCRIAAQHFHQGKAERPSKNEPGLIVKTEDRVRASGVSFQDKYINEEGDEKPGPEQYPHDLLKQGHFTLCKDEICNPNEKRNTKGQCLIV